MVLVKSIKNNHSKVIILVLFVLGVALWLLAAGLFCVLSCSLSYCCVWWILSITSGHLLREEGTDCFAILFSGLWHTLSVMVCLLFHLVALVGYDL